MAKIVKMRRWEERESFTRIAERVWRLGKKRARLGEKKSEGRSMRVGGEETKEVGDDDMGTQAKIPGGEERDYDDHHRANTLWLGLLRRAGWLVGSWLMATRIIDLKGPGP